MSFADDAAGAHHVEMMQVSRGQYRPSHSRPWRDPVDEQVRYLEDLAEQIAACEDELSHLKAKYARVEQWQPEPAPEQVVDFRGSANAGADERAEWAS